MSIHRILVVSACIYCALLLGACSSTNSPTDEGKTGTIAGKVYSTETSDIVPQALITTVPPTASLFSGADGSFRIENVMPGAYVVQALKPGYGSGITSVTVLAGKSSTADILASKTATGLGAISGVVVNEGGLTVGGAIVSTTPATGTITTTSDGRFQLANVPPGTYRVSATGTEGSTGSISVAVLSDLVAQADIRLYRQDPSKAQIKGTVLQAADNKPYVGAVVRLVEAELYDTTDAAGNFEFVNAPVGKLSLEIITKEYPSQILSIVTKAGETQNLSILVPDDGVVPGPVEGLFAYYPCDGNGEDRSGLAHTATLINTTIAEGRTGINDATLKMNGKDSRLELDGFSRLNSTPLTVAFWYKHNGSLENALWAGKYLHPSGIGWLLMLEDKKLVLGFFSDIQFSGVRIDGPNYTPYVGTWTHIAMTIDRDATKLYINGDRVASAGGVSDGFGSTSDEPFRVGSLRSGNPASKGMLGLVDDVYIYTRSLTEIEIQSLISK